MKRTLFKNCCDNPVDRDWTTTAINDDEVIEHICCIQCESHRFRGKFYTKDEWYEKYCNVDIDAIVE